MSKRRIVTRTAHGQNGHVAAAPVAAAGKVLPLVARPAVETRATDALAANRCAKCQSTFVMREPAFLHCYYCGAMTRVPSGSLLEQELFELRSGLRLAS